MDERLRDATARRVLLRHLSERWKWATEVERTVAGFSRDLSSYKADLAATIRAIEQEATQRAAILPAPPPLPPLPPST